MIKVTKKDNGPLVFGQTEVMEFDTLKQAMQFLHYIHRNHSTTLDWDGDKLVVFFYLGSDVPIYHIV